jgi:tetratricopeptide (TPR) repeat protein
MAENWAMVGFAPLFLTAIIWLRGLSFFNLRFLSSMALFGLLGMSFYLLLPLLTAVSGNPSVTFWEVLKLNLAQQWRVIEMFFMSPKLRITLGLLSFSSLVPVFVMSIRWKSSFGDNSQLGILLTSLMFNVVHAVLLGLCIWIAFDPQMTISPRHSGMGPPFLTFYYLGALGIGYYSGYFLLVFGKKLPESRSLMRRPGVVQYLNLPIVIAVWLLAAVAVLGLIYRNASQIETTNGDTMRRYASLIEENLPHTGGYMLSDDPKRLALVHSILVRDGRAKEFVPVDTQSLVAPAYHNFLHKKYPQRWPEATMNETNTVGPITLMQLMSTLAKTNDLYYLHPSFGYYFELFYAEPHGLVYRLKSLPKDTLLPPVSDKNLIAENEAFWTKTAMPVLAPVERILAPPDPNAPKSWGEKKLAKYHITRDAYPNFMPLIGTFVSRDLDFWGVQLQRADELEKAAARFEDAIKFDGDNVVASINLQFNQTLRSGGSATVDLSKPLTDQFGKYGTWIDVLNANGPFDEPSFCFETGLIFARDNGLYRQAMDSFNRVMELVPDNLSARMWLGLLYLNSRLPDRAYSILKGPLEDPKSFLVGADNEEQLNQLVSAVYFQQNKLTQGSELLERELALHPDDTDLLTHATEAYLLNQMYDKALAVIDRSLKLTPDSPVWLFEKGYAYFKLNNYDAAIAAFNRVLTLQPDNKNAVFYRAVANLNSGRLDAARTDYLQLQQTYTNSYAIAYGLGDIAWRQHDTNEAIRNYKIYVAHARTNSDEGKMVLERLHQLGK